MTATDSFDFVIVGGGTAGCLLAARLSENPATSVCLLEAGPTDKRFFVKLPAGYMKTLGDRTITWRFETTPIPRLGDRSILIRQGRLLGGTSSINGMAYVRGQAEDYDEWSADGCEGWSWSDVLPAFRRVERYLGLEAESLRADGAFGLTDNDWRTQLSEAFIEAAIGTGIPRNPDYNSGSQEGVGYYQRAIECGWRNSSSSSFLGPALRRPNLKILTGAQASRIILSDRKAVGAEYVRVRDRSIGQVSARREVIVCAGAVNTPKLLQLSGIGPGGLLSGLGIAPAVDLNGVGSNLRDHFSVRLTARTDPGNTINEIAGGLKLVREFARWLLGKPGIFSITPGLVCAFARCNPSSTRPDVQCFFSAGSFAANSDRLEKHPGITCGTYALRPWSTGSVTAASPDMMVAPNIDPNYLADPRDQELTVAAVRLGKAIFASGSLRRFGVRETNPGPDIVTDEQILSHALSTGGTTHHLVGTAKMGTASDPHAVVDCQLRVHGLQSLRIADASVMPSMPSGNTMAPTLMIAEKAAGLIMAR